MSLSALALLFPIQASLPVPHATLPQPPSNFYWFDFDGDGQQDALVIELSGTVRLLRNAGAGSFAETTSAAGLDQIAGVRSALLGDFDLDGAMDLVFAGDAGALLYRQEQGVFVDVTTGAGLAGLGPLLSAGWVHANDDRWPDLHLVGPQEHRIFSSEEGGRFTEVELPAAAVAGSSTGVSVSPATLMDAPAATPTVPTPTTETANSGVTAGARTSVAPGARPETASSFCAARISDQSGGGCLTASSTPMLGTLYPLGSELMIDAFSGYVGIGTTAPNYALEVVGQAISGIGNTASGVDSTIGGGKLNSATGVVATVAGGESNLAAGEGAFVGGGLSNLALSNRSTVAGGVNNRAAYRAFAGGGTSNGALGNFSAVVGGQFNEAQQAGSAVGGGDTNIANAVNATIAGGGSGVVTGTHGSIPGGLQNAAAGAYSLAAGRRAKALHDGAFVWADSADADMVSTGPDQFIVGASGGMGIGKAPGLSAMLDVAGSVHAEDTIVSTKPAGAPFQVASADLNTNLNADMLDGLHAGAFSQFGTSVDTGEIANGAITGAKVGGGQLADVHMSPTAAIDGTKVAPDFGGQDVVTTGRMAIGTATLGEQLTVAGTIESLGGGFKFPDGTVQATAQLTGPQGATGATGATGPTGPPGSCDPPEPTGQIGQLALTFSSGSFSSIPIFAFAQFNDPGPFAPSFFAGVPVFQVTIGAGEWVAQLHGQDALYGEAGIDFEIDIDLLGQPVNPQATLSIDGSGAFAWELVERAFTPDGPGAVGRVDVAFMVQGSVLWEFDPGTGSVASATFSPDSPGAPGALWTNAPGFTLDPPVYQVWGGELQGSPVAGVEIADTGEFRRTVSASQGHMRSFEIVKPVSVDTVNMLAWSLWSSQPNDPGNVLPLAGPMRMELMDGRSGPMGVPITTYSFDNASLREWRIEFSENRVQEVMVFQNVNGGNNHSFGTGEVTTGGVTVTW